MTHVVLDRPFLYRVDSSKQVSCPWIEGNDSIMVSHIGIRILSNQILRQSDPSGSLLYLGNLRVCDRGRECSSEFEEIRIGREMLAILPSQDHECKTKRVRTLGIEGHSESKATK